MRLYLYLLLCAAFLGGGLWLAATAALRGEKSYAGRRTLRRIAKWERGRKSVWNAPSVSRITAFLSRFVYMDETARESLTRQLYRAGTSITPEQFTARKYVIALLGGAGILVCALFGFWMGVILCALVICYGIMRQRELITRRIKERDETIAAEMPRFVRSVCRSLRSNRDIRAALTSYRKVAGAVLGSELDILLADMQSGGAAGALQRFQQRLGTESAFRLCSTLTEIDRGIDQTATLEYLADDMAQQMKLNLQKTLSVRPAQMRRTYLPAVGVCVAMIMYVLIVFVMDQLNNLF